MAWSLTFRAHASPMLDRAALVVTDVGSLIAYGMLGYLLVAFWPPARRHAAITAAVTVALILAIGLTRLYLGVHYLSDVIGGFAAGTVWVSACVTGVEIALRQRGIAPWEVGLAQDEAA